MTFDHMHETFLLLGLWFNTKMLKLQARLLTNLLMCFIKVMLLLKPPGLVLVPSAPFFRCRL